ncbi:hypothetical protein MTO96_049731 [Rhipicephalus appendiculatus]
MEGKPVTCKAAIAWNAGQPLKLENVEVAAPKHGEVRIKMSHASLCPTDAQLVDGPGHPDACVFPCIPGHEGAGTVESVGLGVKRLKTDPPLSHREAERILKDEGKAAPAVVSPPAAVPSAPDNEVQKDMVIGALVAAVQTLIGTLPQAGPVFELCKAAPHPATKPQCPRWQHERKVLETIASADPPLSHREAKRILKDEGKAAPATLIGTLPQAGPVFELCKAAPHPATKPQCPRWQHERKVLETIASADPPLSHREAKRILKDEGKAAPAVVSPPATVPSAPDNEVQKDIVIGALVAAVQTLIGTLPQAGPVFELCKAAPHPATKPQCPRWQHERKVLETIASADPPLSHREAKRILKDEGKAAPAVVSPPCHRTLGTRQRGSKGHGDWCPGRCRADPHRDTTAGRPRV